MNTAAATRPRIGQQYAIAATSRQRGDSGRLRLLDCLKVHYSVDERAEFMEPKKGEFGLIDKHAFMGALFEWPEGYDSAEITRMVEAFFGARSIHADKRLWIV